ncbi:MAG: TIGR02996 domain-containing protein [Gemmataceae bacterium]|nr:TIGR02996 domain-containing protein [Gemmataceae bacterium]
MTDTEAALLAAIAANPEEDTPRLVYADYLDERGDKLAAARAEFIRLQVMLYRAPADTLEVRVARTRANGLLELFAAPWGFPIQTSYRFEYKVRRGFIDEVTAPAADAPRVCALLEREPVLRLTVTRDGRPALPGAPVDALDVPSLEKVRHLELRSGGWNGEAVAAVFAYKHLPPLTSFALSHVLIRPGDVESLVRNPRLGSLSRLRITGCGRYAVGAGRFGVGDAGAEEIANSPVLANLRELSLRSGDVETAGAVALADSPYLRHLTELNLTENPGIGADGRAALVERFGNAVLLSPLRDD